MNDSKTDEISSGLTDGLTNGLRGLKPPVEIPETATSSGALSWQIWSCIILVFLFIAWASWKYLRHHEKSAANSESIALASINKLTSESADHDNSSFVMQVSTILRQYIETDQEVKALRLSTEEFFKSIDVEKSPLHEHKAPLQQFLTQCDFVKFARGTINSKDRDQLVQCTRSTIQKLASNKP